MSRLREWQFWLPRLMFLVVVLLAVQYGLGRMTRAKVIGLIEAVAGARVDVAHVRVSLVGGPIVLRDLRVAEARRPLVNLVEADRCELDVAGGPLLHKRAVIERGEITGLRFATPRRESGAPYDARPAAVARSIQWWTDETNRQTEEWLEQLDRQFDPKLIDQFESIKRTAGLCDRVPLQAAALDERVQALARRAEELQAKVNRAIANPLRHGEFLRTVVAEIPALEREFQQAASEVEQLPYEIDGDRRAIVTFRRQDEEWLRKELQIPPVDSDALTTYLLRKQVTAPLDELIGWLRLMRTIVPAEAAPATPAGQRGQEILFAGCERSPQLLIRELALAGTACVGGRPVELRGTLSNYSSAPGLQERPLRVKLSATGEQPLVFQATCDRAGGIARDEIIVDSTSMILPPSELGESEKLRLRLAPSLGSLSISVSVDGDRLAGDIQLVQKQVRITPCVGGALSEVQLNTALEDTLGDIGAVATRISLSGTLEEPKCRLWSNLGPAVAEAMDRALRRATELYARRLVVEAQQRVDQQLTELERQVFETQQELRPQLTQAAGRLGEVAAQQKPPQRITTEHVGRRLPANSLLR